MSRDIHHTTKPIFREVTIIDETITNIIYAVKATYEKETSIGAEAFGRPNTNPPAVEDLDNLTLYAFTVDTDSMTFKFPVPSDYDSGPLSFRIVWTNDGGIDDYNRYVRWRIDYRIADENEVLSGTDGSLAVDDQYPSPNGRVEARTVYMHIDPAYFTSDECVYLKLSAVTAPAPQLTCEPRLVGMCHKYKASTIFFPPPP